MFTFLKKKKVRKPKKQKLFFIFGVVIIIGVAFFVSYSFSQSNNQAVLDISFSSDNYDAATKTFYDRSGEGNHGVSLNDANFVNGPYNKVNGAISFNGLNDYIDLSKLDRSALTNASVSFWRRSVDNTQWLLLRGQTNSHYLMAISTGNFYHANAGTNVKIYEDGKEVLKDSRDGQWHHYVATGVDLSAWTTLTLNNYGGWQYKGHLSEITIYNYSLSPEEVQSLYKNKRSVTASSPLSSDGLIGYFKMSVDTYIEGTNNFVYNPTGKLISNGIPGTYKPGWDETLHSDAITVYNWSSGYNGGVGSPAIGYHAKWVYEGIEGANDPCIKFVDKNDVYNLGHRWQGISQYLGTPASLGLAVGDKITISWKQKVDVLNRGSQVGLYHHLISTGSYSFNSSIATIYGNNVNNWEQVSFTITIDNDWDLNKNFIIYVYSSGSSYGTTWVDNIQVEKKDHPAPFVSGTRIGRLTDSSPYENHGTTPINQSFILTEDRFGKEGGAMSFDGLSNYIDAGNSNILNSNTRTISAWIKTTSTGTVNNSGTIVSKIANTPPHNGFALNINRENAGKLYYYAGSWYGTNSSDYNNGNWRHVVVVHEGTSLRFYKDGVLDGSYTVPSPTNYEANLLIGKERDGAPRLFNGSIDDVRIYNRALSEGEIKSLYDSYSPKTTTGSLEQGLILDMPLKSKYTKSETAGSQIMTDRTAYSRDGQNNGATITEDGASFDGVDDYVNLGKKLNDVFNSTKPWSIQQWVNYGSGSSYYPQFSIGGHAAGNGPGFTIHGTNGRIEGGDGVSHSLTGYVFGKSLVNLGWVHTVVTYNGQKIQAYIDGEPKGSIDWSYGIGDNSNYNLYFSRFWGPYGKMSISNVLIYNRALSEDEVKTLYNRGRSDVGIMFQTKN